MNDTRRILIFAERGADYSFLLASLRDLYPQQKIIPANRAWLDSHGDAFDPYHTAGFFLPGASDANYDHKLGPANVARLKRFIDDGGAFGGFCAGAYHAAGSIDWFSWNDRRKSRASALGVFNYEARGPIRELLDPAANPDSGDPLAVFAPASITYQAEQGPIRLLANYWGGPLLMPKDGTASLSPLAIFNDLAGQPPAMLMKDIGQGRAFISAIHPEIPIATFLRNLTGIEQAGLKRFSRTFVEQAAIRLAAHESDREIVFRDIMAKLFPAMKQGPFTP